MERDAITIIEPHADDAFLSLHGHIKEWIKDGVDVCIVTLSGDTRRLQEAERYALTQGCEWTDDRNRQARCAGETRVIVPLGIKHPDHIDARLRFGKGDCWFYVDQPYALCQRDRCEVTTKLKGMEIVSFMKPHARKWRHLTIFESQKSYFSHFHRADAFKPAAFEMVVRKA